jgi:hypothetical protein
VPRAKVTALVRGTPVNRPNRSEPTAKPLVGCWVTRQWSNGLTIRDRPADWVDDDRLKPLAPGSGLASVTVVREHDDTDVSVCGYLVDTYCLGVKNAREPTMVDRRELTGFLDHYYAAYHDGAGRPRSTSPSIWSSEPSSTPAASASTPTATSTGRRRTSAPGNRRAGSRSAWTAPPRSSRVRTTTRPA